MAKQIPIIQPITLVTNNLIYIFRKKADIFYDSFVQ